MLEAREKSANLEYEIFMRIREEVSKYIQRLQALAQGIATVDVLQSLAVVAETQHLIRPEFGDDSRIDIQKGRHAVVEKVMGAQTYIPNTIQMAEDTSIQLITGPNMSGKVNLHASVSHDGGYWLSWVLMCQQKAPIYRFLMRFLPV